jgi:DNA-binding MarR family transcriptional regulator
MSSACIAAEAGELVNMVNEMAATREKRDAVAVASRLRPVLLRLGRELRREAISFGITGGQAALLAVVDLHGPIGLGELAGCEGVSPAAMSKHVDRLEARGLVERAPDSTGDGRRVQVELTAEGARVLRRVRSHRTAWLAARLGRLEPRALDAIEAALEPLAGLLAERA